MIITRQAVNVVMQTVKKTSGMKERAFRSKKEEKMAAKGHNTFQGHKYLP